MAVWAGFRKEAWSVGTGWMLGGVHWGAHPMPSTEGCDLPLSLADGELEAPEP